MTTVEYRLLRFTLSHRHGDQVTVGLVFWDGHRLSVASGTEPLRSFLSASEFRDAEAMIRAQLARADELSRLVNQAGTTLADMFKVQEGTGGAVSWRPIVAATHPNPTECFKNLCHELRLAPGLPANAIGVVTRTIGKSTPEESRPLESASAHGGTISIRQLG